MTQSTAEIRPSTNGSSRSAPQTVGPKETSAAEIERIFKLQQAHQFTVANTTARERKAKLKKLHDAVLAHQQDIRDALHADFQKHPAEVDLTEIFVITSEIKHAMKHVSKWMRPKKMKTPSTLLGSSSHIHYEPHGVCLLISPWNYPVNLTFAPLASAIAAGNCVIIKPSEVTAHSSAVMKKIVDEIFDENEIALVEGAVETSTSLLSLPFNHIFFTGSPAVGKIVMAAAAKHLTSVTLELGGKSPIIVDETANIDQTARRLMWGKLTNNGQTCIAPDYLFVHESKKDELLERMGHYIRHYYGDDVKKSESYARIVNNRHFQRIDSYLEDAKERGATFVHGGATDGSEDYIEPTVVTDVPLDAKLMTEEIFGPVIPVNTYKTLDEPLEVINSKEKPLALYIHSRNKANIKRIIDNTRAGGTVINHNTIHFMNNNMPFGGANNSGIGKGHGETGFEAFSNARGVLNMWSPFLAIRLMTAPFTAFKQKLVDLSIKYF